MTATQRKKAEARIKAFEEWHEGILGTDAAVKASGVSRSRFYRLAAEWRAARSLASLGALRGSGAAVAKLDSDAVNALQAVIPDIVRLNEGARVSQLVRLMVERANVPPGKLPGKVRLRQIVENELRRVAATGEAGHAVRFDCSAINLPRADGRPYILFTCLDTGTRLILGAAVAQEPEALFGYRAAAADALQCIGGPLAKLPWALRLTRIDLTAGVDIEQSVALVWHLMGGGVRANVQLARVEKRFGRYFRQCVGERIGRVSITPGRTSKGLAMPDNGDMSAWTLAEAAAAVATAVEAHNADALGEVSSKPRGRPPADLLLALELIAGDLEDQAEGFPA
jgi:hypothetical protein